MNQETECSKKRQKEIADRILSRIRKKTNFQTTDELNEEIYVGDKLKVVEGSNCLNSGVVKLEGGEFKINGDLLSDFLDGEHIVIRSRLNNR